MRQNIYANCCVHLDLFRRLYHRIRNYIIQLRSKYMKLIVVVYIGMCLGADGREYIHLCLGFWWTKTNFMIIVHIFSVCGIGCMPFLPTSEYKNKFSNCCIHFDFR